MNMTSHKGNHIYNLDQSIICFIYIYIYVIWFELIFTPKEIDWFRFCYIGRVCPRLPILISAFSFSLEHYLSLTTNSSLTNLCQISV